MNIQVGVREFIKDFNKLQNIDIVEIIDKKTNNLKGIYLSKEEAQRVKKLLEKEREKEKKERLKKFKEFAGNIGIDEKFKNLEGKELKEAVAKAKAGLLWKEFF